KSSEAIGRRAWRRRTRALVSARPSQHRPPPRPHRSGRPPRGQVWPIQHAAHHSGSATANEGSDQAGAGAPAPGRARLQQAWERARPLASGRPQLSAPDGARPRRRAGSPAWAAVEEVSAVVTLLADLLIRVVTGLIDHALGRW